MERKSEMQEEKECKKEGKNKNNRNIKIIIMNIKCFTF